MDLRKIKTLIDLVQQSGIAELEITEGEEKVRISRGAPAAPPAVAPPVTLVPVAPPDASSAAPATGAEPTLAEGQVLKSPMVGTFYRSAAPGSKPFVEPGQEVKAGDVVCIIEAMKLLNEIEADRDGVVRTILVDNGQPVEYGQPLMIIE